MGKERINRARVLQITPKKHATEPFMAKRISFVSAGIQMIQVWNSLLKSAKKGNLHSEIHPKMAKIAIDLTTFLMLTS